MNCHGCKWLDRYKEDGRGYCCRVERSRTQRDRVRRPGMGRCELYEAGDFASRHTRRKPMKICGTCRYNCRDYDGMAGEANYCCGNPDSDCYGLPSLYDDGCDDWEGDDGE